MGRSFAITTSAAAVQLDGRGEGTFTFTVSNALGRPVRARTRVEPQGPSRPQWVALEGESERDFASDGTHQFTARVVVPPGTPGGRYGFVLSVVGLDNPDEEFTAGPQVSVEVPLSTPQPPPRRFPWWAVALAAGVLIITLAAVLIARGRGGEEPGVGGAGTGEPARPGASFQTFDGRATYVELGNPRALDFTGPITLEAWVRPRTAEGLANILAHGYTLNPNAEVFLRVVNGSYQVGAWNGQESSVMAPVPAEDLGQWVHLAGVYDGRQWTLYRNAEPLASGPRPFGAVSVPASWAIGARGGGSERFFLGDIRDVRIWNLPRTQAELRAGMAQAPNPRAPGLMGHWPLNEGQGVVTRDATPHQNDGLIRQGMWSSE